jgi:hypothetical protein
MSVFTPVFTAQSQERQDLDPSHLEDFLAPDAEIDLEAFVEEIEALRDRPLCLAIASREALASLPFLSAADAARLHRTLEKHPGNWSEVRDLFEHDHARFALLRSCTVMNCEEKQERAVHFSFRSRFQQEDNPRRGFLDGSYSGSRARMLERLLVHAGTRLSGGLLIEKDPGETRFADHVSGYVAMQDYGLLRRAVLGDFTVTAGQGLVFWQAFAMGKSSQVTGQLRSPALLRPTASSTEGFGMRGVGLQLEFAPIDVALLFSSAARDATVDEEAGTAGSFSIDGLHRSSSERERAGSVRETLLGLHLRCREALPGLGTGISMLASRYSLPSLSQSPFAFEGDNAWNMGMDLRWESDAIAMFVEAAWSHTHAGAIIAGTELQPAKSTLLSLLYRRYDARYLSMHGGAFGERSGNTQNEEGMYCGIRLRPARGLRLDFWADVFRFPNRTYFMHLPTSGNEMLLSVTYRALPKTTLSVRLRRERKDQTVAATDAFGREIRPLTPRSASGLRLELMQESSEQFRLRLRAEYVHVTHDDWLPQAEGVLLGAELRWRPRAALTVVGSICTYRSDDWDARLYRFEHDVRGVMRNVACDGEGMRSYVLVNLRVVEGLEIGARYALMLRDGVREIGEGKDGVNGDRQGMLSLQVDWRR